MMLLSLSLSQLLLFCFCFFDTNYTTLGFFVSPPSTSSSSYSLRVEISDQRRFEKNSFTATRRNRYTPNLRSFLSSSTTDKEEEFIWEDCTTHGDGSSGCKILRPSSSEPPRAVIHFLGGAFVSPEPTVAYRYVLESLVRKGYAIIVTPFAVDFNYRKVATNIREMFLVAKQSNNDEISSLIGDNSAVPLVSMGHSLGSLMHVLLTCMYPEDFSNVDGTILISYNNKPVEGAIPFFKELFVPAMAPFKDILDGPIYDNAKKTNQDLRKSIFDTARETITTIRKDILNLTPNESLIPGFAGAKKPNFALKVINDMEAATVLIDQIPDVLSSISQGASEFEPTPTEMRQLVSSSYQLKNKSSLPPLVIKFDNDGIDESDILTSILPTVSTISSTVIPGTHVTPLAIDPDASTTPLVPVPQTVDDALNIRSTLLSNADTLVDTIDEYITTIILNYVTTKDDTSIADATINDTATAAIAS